MQGCPACDGPKHANPLWLKRTSGPQQLLCLAEFSTHVPSPCLQWLHQSAWHQLLHHVLHPDQHVVRCPAALAQPLSQHRMPFLPADDHSCLGELVETLSRNISAHVLQSSLVPYPTPRMRPALSRDLHAQHLITQKKGIGLAVERMQALQPALVSLVSSKIALMIRHIEPKLEQ